MFNQKKQTFKDEDIGQLSGAYIFRPSADTLNGSIPYVANEQFSVKVYKGSSVTVFAFNSTKITQYLRVYHNEESLLNKVIESETTVNSIDISDKQGKELTLNLQSAVNNGQNFFTDSNGLELQ